MPIVLDGTLGIDGPLGTASVPSYGNTTATTTGLYFPTSTTLGLSTNGTAALTIDASQNVGIGTSSPASKLDIGSGNLNFSGSAQRITGDFSNATIASRLMFQTSTSNGASNVEFIPNGTNTTTNIIASNNSSDPANTSAASLTITNTEVRVQSFVRGTGTALPLTFYTGGSERMHIDSSGNVGIGTSSPSSYAYNDPAPLVVANTAGGSTVSIASGATSFGQLAFANGTSGTSRYNGYIKYDHSSNYMAFYTNAGAERMRIDSSGNLLVGTTDATVGAGTGAKIVTFGGVAGSRMQLGSTDSTNTGIGYSMYSTGASAYRFYVGYGGTIYATSTTITAISDQRLKENIQDIDVGLDAIMALKPRKFDWKTGKGKDKKGDRGWIAQEFEQVFPEMIDTWEGPVPEGEEPYKAVNADLIPVLVKAIQEQQAQIALLKAELDALKGTK